MSVMCIRLPAGEEIMGNIVYESSSTVTIQSPAAVMLVPGQDQSGQVNIGLMPWLPYSDQDQFEISRDKILTMHTPNVELLNNYNRMFGSGIQLVTNSTIIK